MLFKDIFTFSSGGHFVQCELKPPGGFFSGYPHVWALGCSESLKVYLTSDGSKIG